MTRDEIVELFARRSHAWTARDVGALARTHAANGIVSSPMFGELTGREAIADSYASLFRMFPDWTFLSESLLIDGDRIAQSFSATATHSSDFMGLPASGRKFRIEGVRLHTMKDGLIQEEQRIYDFTGLLIQVGVLKSKPAV
jgi:steroid delta-isomerase-like uncharacterized protein